MIRLLVPFVSMVLACGARAADDPPAPPREFRAAWIATVANIDWPSKPGLKPDEQRQEAVAILDRLASLNMNVAVLQVRTSADALYDSPLEPWSYYLTGTQGKPPEPYYDPLAFWIDEAHARGIQLHAWINPFRAKLNGATYEPAATHVAKVHPDWVKSYGGFLWLDPGEPAARARTLAVVADLVNRYDLDGIHIDDYFYPYPVADPATKAERDFPDDPSWEAYRKSGGTKERADWRRENVSRLIAAMHETIHATKPRVQFGISPFGIPRPGKPAGVVGFDQYAKLYADTELWLRSGWCDYWTPQLYWKVHASGQPYEPLLAYWITQNVQKRHLWPGLSISRVHEGANGYEPSEILEQIAITRRLVPQPGNVLFSMKALMRNPSGLSDELAKGPYREAALVPPTPWLDREPPAAPEVALRSGRLTIAPGPGEAPFLWAIWILRDGKWTFVVRPATQKEVPLEGSPRRVVVAAVDRLANLSETRSVEP